MKEIILEGIPNDSQILVDELDHHPYVGVLFGDEKYIVAQVGKDEWNMFSGDLGYFNRFFCRNYSGIKNLVIAVFTREGLRLNRNKDKQVKAFLFNNKTEMLLWMIGGQNETNKKTN